MSSSNDPWAWLGLLKWSLAYSDGTSDAQVAPMSEADRKFLETVMKEGIINEGERMKTILEEVTEKLQKWKQEHKSTKDEEDSVLDLLQELRDIVEQIDYANAFCSLQGLPFLLGCIQETAIVPRSTRMACLGILSTLCQNNPQIQKQLLEKGALQILSDIFFSTTDDAELRAKLLHAISANVRSYDVAEAVFDQLEQSVPLLEDGLSHEKTAPKALFLLRAILTSDTTTRARFLRFQSCLIYAIDNYCTQTSDLTLRETTLEMMQSILEQKVSVNAVLSRKNNLVGTGVSRVAELRNSTDDAVEIELWEAVIQLLARSEPDSPVAVANNDQQVKLVAQ